MKSTEVRLAEIDRDKMMALEVSKILNHPYMITLLCFVLVEFLQGTKLNGQPLMGNISGTALETAFITESTLSAFSKSGVLTELFPLLIK